MQDSNVTITFLDGLGFVLEFEFEDVWWLAVQGPVRSRTCLN